MSHNYYKTYKNTMNLCSSVSRVTGCGLNDHSSFHARGRNFLAAIMPRPTLGPPSFLSSVYGDSFPVVPRLRMVGFYLHSHIYLYGVAQGQLQI